MMPQPLEREAGGVLDGNRDDGLPVKGGLCKREGKGAERKRGGRRGERNG